MVTRTTSLRLLLTALLIAGSFVVCPPLRAQPSARADPATVRGAASHPVLLSIRGEGFTDSIQVIVDDIGVAIGDRRRYQAVTDTSFQVALVLGAEAAPWTLRVQNGDEGEASAPFGIRVVPPIPEITSLRITAPDREGVRRLSVFSRDATRYTYVVWRGDSVATTPLLTSDNPFAVTLGLAAEVRDDDRGLRDFFEPNLVRIVTPGPGGGASASFAAPVAWSSLVRRWQFWSAVLLACAGVAFVVGMVVSRKKSRELQRRVEEKTAALRESTTLRAELFSSVAHDLRTPLTVVLSALDTVVSRDRLGSDDRIEIEAARRAGARMRRLAGRFAGAAQDESGETRLDLRPLELVQVVQEALTERSPWHDRRGVTTAFEAEHPVTVRADAEAVGRILDNLLDNAYRFTPREGQITVEVAEEDGYAVLAVRDSGPGFSHDFAPRAFDRYVRGPRAPEEPSYEGTGMGLAYVRSFAERMGGAARAEPGPGGRVEVRLPLTTASRSGLGARYEPDQADTPELSLDRPQLVLAEDDAELRGQLSRLLSEEFEVEAVPDGRVAFEAVRRLRPSVVVSDIMMPALDGVGLVRALRAETWGETVPVVLVTALGKVEQIVTAFEAGADDYVTKPFMPAVLLARVRRLVGGRPRADASPAPVGPDGRPLSPEDVQLVGDVRAVIEANLSTRDFDVATLSREVYLSKAQLGRRLRSALDVSPAKYVERIRLDHAAGLLRSGGRLVKEVAAMVGYRDIKTFSRAFQRQYGMPPSKWGDVSA